MKKLIIIPALAVLLAACAGMEAPSEQGKTEISTGSNIPRRVGVRDRDVVTGSKEEYERQMDKAHTLPRSKEAQY